jgi:tRNA A37 threonylcarbamoyladenosine dehydratase
MRALCDYFITALNRRLKKLHLIVGLELAQLGVDAVYSMPDLVVPSPDRAKVAKRRK